MADVVVVGAGLGGMAVAARLAKQRHHVTIVDRRSTAGGALSRIERDGFSWDAGPASTALPAVLRDLFRKSGRPLERYVDLTLRPVARRHVFADRAFVDLPTGSRAAQIDAIDAGLGAGRGREWAAFVDAQADVWEQLRGSVLDDPRGGLRLSDRALAKRLSASTSLEKLLKRSLPDEPAAGDGGPLVRRGGFASTRRPVLSPRSRRTSRGASASGAARRACRRSGMRWSPGWPNATSSCGSTPR